MAQKKRKTRNQKKAAGTRVNSKYASKVSRRKKFAAKLGMDDAPWPVLLGAE